MRSLVRNNWAFGAAALLLAVVIAAGGFVLGRTTDNRPSQADVRAAAHHAAERATRRGSNEKWAEVNRELPPILRELAEVMGARELEPADETGEALKIAERALFGQVRILAPELLKINYDTDEPDGIEGELLTPAMQRAVREGVNFDFGRSR